MNIEVSETLKSAYLIDDKGYILDVIVADINEFNVGNIVFQSINNIYYKPKWNGFVWIEGATQEEIDTIKYEEYLVASKPNQEDIEKAKYELNLIETLKSLGVVV